MNLNYGLPIWHFFAVKALPTADTEIEFNIHRLINIVQSENENEKKENWQMAAMFKIWKKDRWKVQRMAKDSSVN